MSERRKYRAGDVVRHIELGEEHTLACDEWADRVCACGWPPSWNQATEVELVTPATDEERLARLRATAAMGCSVRSAQAQASLDAEPKPRRTLADVVANPPSGWTHRPGLDGIVWKWCPNGTGPLRAALELDEDGDLCYPPRIVAYTLRDEAAAHRAVADLLDLLAEVSDV